MEEVEEVVDEECDVSCNANDDWFITGMSPMHTQETWGIVDGGGDHSGERFLMKLKLMVVVVRMVMRVMRVERIMMIRGEKQKRNCLEEDDQGDDEEAEGDDGREEYFNVQ